MVKGHANVLMLIEIFIIRASQSVRPQTSFAFCGASSLMMVAMSASISFWTCSYVRSPSPAAPPALFMQCFNSISSPWPRFAAFHIRDGNGP